MIEDGSFTQKNAQLQTITNHNNMVPKTRNSSSTISLTSIVKNSALPMPTQHKCAYYAAARKPVRTETPCIALYSLEGEYAPASDPLPSGPSFLLQMHRRREHSATPFQKMTRKEREYVETSAIPLQRMTKNERNSLLQDVMDLL
jgi:hypothetical protein